MNGSNFDLVDDLVLDRVLYHLSARSVVRCCTLVNRRWLRVSRLCRHVALHTLAVQTIAPPPGTEMSAIAKDWLRTGRLAFLCRAVTRAEFVDEVDAHMNAAMLAARYDDRKALTQGLEAVGTMVLALASPQSDASLLDDSAVKAVLFFVRPQFKKREHSFLTNCAVGIVANLAVLPRGRALLLRAGAHESLLQLVEGPVGEGTDQLLQTALTAASNLMTLPACRELALRDLPRVAAALRAIVLSREPAASIETQLQARRVIRELVGKVDAALINAHVDSIVATRLIDDMVDGTAATALGTRTYLEMVGQTLATLAEIGRPSVRPALARTLLLRLMPSILGVSGWLASLEQFLHPLSICLAQAVLSREFGEALGSAQRGALGQFVSRAFEEFRWRTSAVRLVTVCVQLTRQFGDCVFATDWLRASDHARRIEILHMASRLARRDVSVADAKAFLKRACDAACAKRAELGMTRLSLSQFVQQRDTWIETDDVFCIEPALHFDAVAFDSLESVQRVEDWLRHVRVASDNEKDAMFAYNRALFQVALPSHRASLDELHDLVLELADLRRLCPTTLAYPLSVPGLVAAIRQARTLRVLDKKKR